MDDFEAELATHPHDAFVKDAFSELPMARARFSPNTAIDRGHVPQKSQSHAARRLRARYYKIQARSTPNRLCLGLCWNLSPA